MKRIETTFHFDRINLTMPGRSFYTRKRPVVSQSNTTSAPPELPVKRARYTLPTSPSKTTTVDAQSGGLPSASCRLSLSSNSAVSVHYPPTHHEAWEEEDALDTVILALDVRGRRDNSSSALGACWFVVREGVLFFIEDIKNGGMDAVEWGELTLENERHLLIQS